MICDPATGEWTTGADAPAGRGGCRLGRARRPALRGGWLHRFQSGSACGFYKVGGADFNPAIGFIPDDAVEVLPGFDLCGFADVPWLSVNPTTATCPVSLMSRQSH
jgi:hypothetical protein